jgi:16S rRNA (cytosine1402-N4)-methyltransferase
MPEDASTPETSRPKRRVRYRGTHPRRFEEKYKELNPAKYPEAVQKVLASGKTPAGMHRPIMVKEVLECLEPKSGEIGIDCTLGYGGHASELLRLIIPGGKLIGLDADPLEISKTEQRLREDGFDEGAFQARHANFAALPKVLSEFSLTGVDFILADLGVSSMQIDTPDRGFSFKTEGPLDLRMNPRKGRPASTLLEKISEEELTRALREHADEEHAPLIASGIIGARERQRIQTTGDLRRAIEGALATLPRPLREKEGDKPIRRVFQALRILVNDEFGALENLLRILPSCLNPGGRVAILTFHSGEDRRVKKRFQELERGAIFERVGGPIPPSSMETRENPRSSSGKLRFARKIESTATRAIR